LQALEKALRIQVRIENQIRFGGAEVVRRPGLRVWHIADCQLSIADFENK